MKSNQHVECIAATCCHQRACCAAPARALAGSPSTSPLAVTSFLKALVASSTLLLNLVLSCASSCWMALKLRPGGGRGRHKQSVQNYVDYSHMYAQMCVQ